MSGKNKLSGVALEALIYPLLVIIVMWLVFWADHLFPGVHFYKAGVMPKNPATLPGILLMPFLHAKDDIAHIVNNSIPIYVLLAALIYHYRTIALKVVVISWLLTGIGLWVFAENNNSYHIGMSGIIYALAAFLFTSGVLRKHRPLQGISMFVAFVYGSMIWGIFPMEPHVSWEGHLSGLLTGVLLAFVYRKLGPQAPKYQYEIERDMGIEPPDFEGQWLEQVRIAKEREEERLRQQQGHMIIYHYIPEKEPKPKDDTPEL